MTTETAPRLNVGTYNFAATDDVILDQGVSFFQGDDPAIVVGFANSSLTLLSRASVGSGETAITVSAADFALDLARDALIFGNVSGVFIQAGGSQSVVNRGTIYGQTIYGVYIEAAAPVVNNSGYIAGGTTGVSIAAMDVIAGGITNTGRIAGFNGVVSLSAVGVRTVISNKADAVISGSGNAIFTVSTGSIKLVNDGSVLGGIDLGSPGATESDLIINRGIINDYVALGAGNDTFSGAKGRVTSVLGEDGRDTITTGKGANYIDGGAGNDLLRGGLGAGRDSFAFTTALSATTNVDRIMDFQPNIDIIALDSVIFGGLMAVTAARFYYVGQGTMTPQDRIIYNPANGWLSFDANGSQPGGGPVHFATIGRNAAIDHNDFTIPLG